MKAWRTFALCLFLIFVFCNAVNAYPGDVVVEAIESDSPSIWDISNSGWTTESGVVLVCFESGTVQLQFTWTQVNNDFFEQAFDSGEVKPMGLEIELKDVGGLLTQSLLYPSNDNLPDSAQYEDTGFADGDLKSLTVAISNPRSLSVGTTYWARFDCPELRTVDSVTFSMQVQLTGDMLSLFYDRVDLYDSYPQSVVLALGFWLHAQGNVPANRLFVIHQPDERMHFQFQENGENLFYWNGLSEGDKRSVPYGCEGDQMDLTLNASVIRYIGVDPQTSEVYTVNPTAQSSDANIHITHHHIRPYNKGSWHLTSLGFNSLDVRNN